MQLFLGHNHLEFNSNLKLSKNEIANTSQYQKKKKKVEVFLRQQCNDGFWSLKPSCDWLQRKWLVIRPYSFRLFLHTHSHFVLSYSCTIVDYLRKILFNCCKIIYVFATMSIIDNYGSLFTAQSICQTSYHNVMKTSTQRWERDQTLDSLARIKD